jgi:hypothetical protein
MKCLLFFLASCLFGSFEGIDLEVFGLDLDFYMAGKIADAVEPFLFRCRVCTADLADGAHNNPFTALTIINYHLTRTVREYTSLFPPESTLAAGKNCLTLHEESLLSNYLYFIGTFNVAILEKKSQQENPCNTLLSKAD